MSELDYDGFLRLVADMRDAQQRYFQARGKGDEKTAQQALERSKKLERQVDAHIVRRQCSQPWLFP